MEVFENADLPYSWGRTKAEVFGYYDVIETVQSILVCIAKPF